MCVSTESLQVLRRLGAILSDYPLEQYVRDAKIDSLLYEGNRRQSRPRTSVFRKIIRDQRGALTISSLFGDSSTAVPCIRVCATAPRCSRPRSPTSTQSLPPSPTCWSSRAASLGTSIGSLQAVPFLLGLADLLIGWLLLRQADIALRTLDQQPSSRDQAFYRGKVVAAKFFATNVSSRADRAASHGRA